MDIFQYAQKYRSSTNNEIMSILEPWILPWSFTPTRWMKINIGDKSYYPVMHTSCESRHVRSIELQLWLTRLLAPLMPMAHIVAVKDETWSIHWLSTDVDNSTFQANLSYREKNKAFMAKSIYEYLSKDYDHWVSNEGNNLNISNDGVLYDFNEIGAPGREPDYLSIGNWDESTMQEYAEMIIFWKKYLHETIDIKTIPNIPICQELLPLLTRMNATSIVTLDWYVALNKVEKKKLNRMDLWIQNSAIHETRMKSL